VQLTARAQTELESGVVSALASACRRTSGVERARLLFMQDGLQPSRNARFAASRIFHSPRAHRRKGVAVAVAGGSRRADIGGVRRSTYAMQMHQPKCTLTPNPLYAPHAAQIKSKRTCSNVFSRLQIYPIFRATQRTFLFLYSTGTKIDFIICMDARAQKLF
jgi:hypothetical protein